jgi:HK97 gp10 family phage protein
METVVNGMAALLRNIEKARVAAQKAAELEVERARLAVETTAKKLIMKGPKSGLLYKRGKGSGKKQKYHRASAPGQPPATDTGILASSIESKRDGLSAIVWTEKVYGKYLEFGTRDIEPRPWLTPAVEQNRERFIKVLGQSVVESIDKAVKT